MRCSGRAPPARQQTERVPDNQASIRPARIGDDEPVWPLARDFATSFRPQRVAFDSAWVQLVGDPHTLLLVAESPERGIVGYLLANSHLTFLANGPVAWLEEVMVDEHARHRSRVIYCRSPRAGDRLDLAAHEWAAQSTRMAVAGLMCPARHAG